MKCLNLIVLVTFCLFDSTFPLTRQQLKQRLIERVSQFQIEFHKSLESRRIKRSIDSLRFDHQNGMQEQKVLVRDMEQVVTHSFLSKDLNGVTTWLTISGGSRMFVAWGLESGSIRLAQFDGPNGEIVIKRRFTDYSIKESYAYKMAYFVQGRVLWLVVAYKTKAVPRTYTLAVYQVNDDVFAQRQLIQSDSFMDIDILQEKDVLLAMSSLHDVRIFRWKETQFDEVANKKLKGVRSIALIRVASDLYLATAQADPTNLFKSQFLLFKPSSDNSGSLISHQVLETKFEFTKVRHFVLNGHDYMVYIGPQKGVIYWWSGDGFVQYQSLESVVNAREVSVVNLADGQVLLATLIGNQITFLTQSSDARFVEVYTRVFDSKYQISAIHLASFVNKYLYTFIAVRSMPRNQVNMSPVWRIKLIPYIPARRRNEGPLVDCLAKLAHEVKQREEQLKVLSLRVSKVWVTNRPQTIQAPVVVEGGIKTLGVGMTNIRNLMITNDGSPVPQVTNSQVKFRLDNVTRTAAAIDRGLNKYAFKDKSQTIRGKLTFAQPVQAAQASVGNVVSPELTINGLPFKDLHMNVLRTEGDQVITGKWTFGKGLRATDMLVGNLVNGIKVEDVLLTSANYSQVVTGNIMFGNVTITSGLSMPATGTINNVRLDDVVTTRPGPLQVISGSKNLRQATVAGNVNVRYLTNGRNLAALASKSIKLVSPVPQSINGRITFEGNDLKIENMKVFGLINNVVNVTQMATNGVTKSTNQVITGRKTFMAPVAARNINVKGLVNGINVTRDVVTTNTAQNVLPLIFKAPVKFGGKLETLTINGLDLAKEAVLRSSPVVQVVSARKGFMKGIQVNGDIVMDHKSTIDDVDPSELPTYVMHQNRVEFYGPMYFDQITVNGRVSASRGINGHLIGDLPNRIWLKSANQVINNSVTFLAPFHVHNCRVGTINGMKLPDDVVMKSAPLDQVVTGEKVFLDEVRVPNGPLITFPGVKVNNVDLVAFENQMVRNIKTNGTDPIRGVKTFGKVYVKGHIHANKINGINLAKDVMLRNVPQRVIGPIVINSPETVVRHALHVAGDIKVTDTINGIKLQNWAKEVVTLGSDGSRPITNKYFLGGITADKVSAFGKIGGVNLIDLKNRVVTLSGDQFISAPKNFTGKINFGNHVTTGLLNGFNLTEYIKLVVRKDVPQTIFGEKVVRGRVTVYGNLSIAGEVNFVNLTKLAKDAVSKTRDNYITAPIQFANHIRGPSMTVSETSRLDGLFIKDLIFMDRPNQLNGKLTFADDLSVSGNINIRSGVLSGCDLPRLVREAVPLNNAGRSIVISGKKMLSTLDVDGDIRIGRSVNGLNISQLARQVVTLDGNQVLTSAFTFKDPIVVDHLILRAPVNGINMQALFADAVVKSRPQTITGRKRFSKDVMVSRGPLTISGPLTVRGFVDGVNVTLLSQTLVTRDGNQRISGIKTLAYPGPQVFRRDLKVDGLVSSSKESIKVPNDLVLLNSNEPIPGEIIFAAPVMVTGNMTVKGLIDGVNLAALVNNRISLGYQQESSANLIFKQPLTVDNLIVRRSINGIPVGDLVTRRGNHVLRGNYKINGQVMVDGPLDLGSRSLINGFNFRDLARRTIDVRKGGHLSGQTYITRPVALGRGGMDTRYLNGMNVTRMVKDYESYSSFINHKMEGFRSQANLRESVITKQKRSIDHQSTLLEYFDVFIDLATDNSGRSLAIYNFLPVPTMQNSSLYTVADSIIYWRAQSTLTSCPSYDSVILSITQDSKMSVTAQFKSKVFPAKLDDSAPFVVWDNSSLCNDQVGNVKLKSQFLSSTGLPRSAASFVSHPIPTNNLRDIKTFKSNEIQFAVVVLGSRVVVYRLEPRAQMWLITQDLSASGANLVELVEFSDSSKGHRYFMFVANQLAVLGVPSASMVYEWNPIDHKFIEYQAIYTSSPSAAKFTVSQNGLILVVANEKSNVISGQCSPMGHNSYSTVYYQPVQVYRLISGVFKMIQSVDVPGVKSLATFSLPPSQTLLVAGSHVNGESLVFKLDIASDTFTEVSRIPTRGVINLSAFWSRMGDLFLAVSSDHPGHSKILRAVLSGPPPRLRAHTPFDKSYEFINPSALLSS